MKMVKSLLLGSAAGLVAVGGVQAADLPVKAKPVEYVKICTLYGQGWYYIPGSDTCVRIGGYVRTDYGWNVREGSGVAYSGTQGAFDRTVAQYSSRHRGRVDFDVRTQTPYGTLRSYENFQMQHASGAFDFAITRAFIQWAGFTFGHTQSFTDTWTINDSWHYAAQENASSTGANGVNQIAYTWELGNGMTLTAGADEARRKPLTNLSGAGALKIGSAPGNSFQGQKWPDPHLDFKVNQAWGYFAISGIAHDVSATYYSGAPDPAGPFAGLVCVGVQGGTTQCDHPDDEVGWAVNAGAEFKLDFINPGDRFGAGAVYAVGASGFGGGGRLSSAALFDTGNQVALGYMTDGVFVNGSGIELTTSWTVTAGYEHAWTPQLKTSATAAYTQISYNETASNWLRTQYGGVCTPAFVTGAKKSANVSAGAINDCDPDWGFFQGGIRTQWTPSPGFYLGVDVFYSHVFTGFSGDGSVDTFPTTGARPTGPYIFDDFGSAGVIFRAQRAWNLGG